jgi:hypothetical protein
VGHPGLLGVGGHHLNAPQPHELFHPALVFGAKPAHQYRIDLHQGRSGKLGKRIIEQQSSEPVGPRLAECNTHDGRGVDDHLGNPRSS